MSEYEPFDESAFQVSGDGPGPEVRERVLVKVNRTLRSRRRDRQIANLAKVLVVVALSLNWVVGEGESARMSRWFSNSDTDATRFDNTAISETGDENQPVVLVSSYFALIYAHPWSASRRELSRAQEERQIREWVGRLSGVNGGI